MLLELDVKELLVVYSSLVLDERDKSVRDNIMHKIEILLEKNVEKSSLYRKEIFESMKNKIREKFSDS